MTNWWSPLTIFLSFLFLFWSMPVWLLYFVTDFYLKKSIYICPFVEKGPPITKLFAAQKLINRNQFSLAVSPMPWRVLPTLSSISPWTILIYLSIIASFTGAQHTILQILHWCTAHCNPNIALFWFTLPTVICCSLLYSQLVPLCMWYKIMPIPSLRIPSVFYRSGFSNPLHCDLPTAKMLFYIPWIHLLPDLFYLSNFIHGSSYSYYDATNAQYILSQSQCKF